MTGVAAAGDPRRRAPAPPGARPRSQARRAARLAAAGVLVAGLAAGAALHASGAIDWTPAGVRAAVERAGVWAPLAFGALFALRPLLLLPSWVFLVAAGALFGVVEGTLVCVVGGTLGALGAFGIARVLGREAIERRLAGAAERIDRSFGEHGALWVALLVALPATPLTPIFYAAGLSSLAPLRFAVATAAGLAPRVLLYALFGEALAEGALGKALAALALLAAALGAGLLLRRRLAARSAAASGAAAQGARSGSVRPAGGAAGSSGSSASSTRPNQAR